MNRNILFLDSAAATQKDLNTSQFTQIFEPPLKFPNQPIKIGLHSFSFTNFFVNISSALVNNTFYYTNDLGTPNKYSITIPDGSYSVQALSSAINLGVLTNGHTTGLITVIADYSTNKLIWNISLAGWQLYFPAGSCYAICGMTLNQKVPAAALTTGAYSELGTNVAQFNNVQRIYIHTSLSNNSIFGGRQNNIIDNTSPYAPIGSTQEYQPSNILWMNADYNLSGSSISSVLIYLTDQNGNRIQLTDEFSCTILVQY